MTMSETTETSLKIGRMIAAPVDRIWRAISERDTLVRWFCPGTRTCRLDEYDFREGGRFRLAFEPTEEDGFGGPSPAHGIFKRIVENEEITMTWKWDFPDEDHNEPESRLILRLRDVGGSTEVTLIHEGLPDQDSVAGHYGGWMTVLPKLETVLTRTPEDVDA